MKEGTFSGKTMKKVQQEVGVLPGWQTMCSYVFFGESKMVPLWHHCENPLLEAWFSRVCLCGYSARTLVWTWDFIHWLKNDLDTIRLRVIAKMGQKSRIGSEKRSCVICLQIPHGLIFSIQWNVIHCVWLKCPNTFLGVTVCLIIPRNSMSSMLQSQHWLIVDICG